MPSLISRLTNNCHASTHEQPEPEGTAVQQHPGTRANIASERATNPRLEALPSRQSNKHMRKEVRQIASECARQQVISCQSSITRSVEARRIAYIEALTQAETRLAQLSAAGLSEAAPPFSFSRSTKNGLAFAGGVATKAGQIGAAAAIVAGTGAAVAAVTPITTGFGAFVMTGCLFDSDFGIDGFKMIISPAKCGYRFLRSNAVANILNSINAYPRASAYATRPRFPTSTIAAYTASQISMELSNLYLAGLTEEERTLASAQAALNGPVLPAAMFAEAPPATAPIPAQGSNATAAPNLAPVLQQGALGRWQFPENEDNAALFNTFQTRLSETAEHANAATNPAFVVRVNALVDAMRAIPALRATCFAIAADAVASCGDRIALGLNDMEQALINKKAENGELTSVELIHTGVGSFKKQILDDIAVKKIQDLRTRNISVDELEVRLAYPTELRTQLSLTGVAQSMLYFRSSQVSKRDIAAAEREVIEQLRQGKAIDFLAQWQPWCKEMERANPAVFLKVSETIQAARDAISIMPDHMTEQQWLNALTTQKREEETLVVDLVRKLTQKFIQHHRLTLT